MQTRSRRHFLVSVLAACSGCREAPRHAVLHPGSSRVDGARPEANASERGSAALAELEQAVGGRLGVFALDVQTARTVLHRPDERFALCSTFKWVLAAQVLHWVDRGEVRLDEPVPFGPRDLLEYAPVTSARVGEGALSLGELARVAVVVSDNTAANLLLARMSGPAGLTDFIRAQGDPVTRLDRNEPSLNDNEPGDPRDTTSPRAMVHLLQQLAWKTGLSSEARRRLLEWLLACETGKNRLRAGLPEGFRIGHKTGTGKRGAVGDVAIVWPSEGGPILLASYLSDSSKELPELENAHAEVAKIVLRELARA